MQGRRRGLMQCRKYLKIIPWNFLIFASSLRIGLGCRDLIGEERERIESDNGIDKGRIEKRERARKKEKEGETQRERERQTDTHRDWDTDRE